MISLLSPPFRASPLNFRRIRLYFKDMHYDFVQR
jgi:hypothetical protein